MAKTKDPAYDRNKALEARLKAKLKGEAEKRRIEAAKKANAEKAERETAARKAAMKEAKKKQAALGGALIIDSCYFTQNRILRFEKRFAELLEYKKEHGHCNVPHLYLKNKTLGNWVCGIRNGTKPIDEERRLRLIEIGFVFQSLLGAHNKATFTQEDLDKRQRSEGLPSSAMIRHQDEVSKIVSFLPLCFSVEPYC